MCVSITNIVQIVHDSIHEESLSQELQCLLKSRSDSSRLIWAADSFSGLPVASAHFANPLDSLAQQIVARVPALNQASEVSVLDTLRDLGGLHARVRRVKGLFHESLFSREAAKRIRKIALLRLDADYYQSTSCCWVLCILIPVLLHVIRIPLLFGVKSYGAC